MSPAGINRPSVGLDNMNIRVILKDIFPLIVTNSANTQRAGERIKYIIQPELAEQFANSPEDARKKTLELLSQYPKGKLDVSSVSGPASMAVTFTSLSRPVSSSAWTIPMAG
jgi:hypothetical protein